MGDNKNFFSDFGLLIPAGIYRDTNAVIVPPIAKKGTGTYDCYFDIDKYQTSDEATAAHDYVEVNHTVAENGLRAVELHHIQAPDEKTIYVLERQTANFGMDVSDDRRIGEIAIDILSKYK